MRRWRVLGVVCGVLAVAGCVARSRPPVAAEVQTLTVGTAREAPAARWGPLPPEVKVGASFSDIQDWALGLDHPPGDPGPVKRCRMFSLPILECGEWMLVFRLGASEPLLAVLRSAGDEHFNYELPAERRGEATSIEAVWMADGPSRTELLASGGLLFPPQFKGLGQPCEAAAENPDASWKGGIICGSEGRVNGLYRRAVDIPAPPRGAVPLVEATSSGSYVVLDGEWLWVRWVTCGNCRAIQGWSFIGKPEGLDAVDLRLLQARMGFPESVPPLRTARAWRESRVPSPPPAR